MTPLPSVVVRPGQTDRWLLVASGLLCLVSLVSLSSASATIHPTLVAKQAIWIGIGLVVSLVVARTSYAKWVEWSLVLYSFVVVLLLVVFVAGTVRLGAARWITIFGLSVQPSELAKLATALILARSLAAAPSPLAVRAVVLSVVLAGLPAVLVFLQPDLGSASILGALWLGTVWVAGLAPRHLAVLVAGVLGLLPVGWRLLKDYQQTRLLAFLNPHADPLGAGYTIIQSQIAIGSGQVLGRGWMAGTQNQLNFLPERHADFLYSVIGEEWGFLGASLVVVLVGLLIWRAVGIALRNSDPQGRVLATALVCWLGYQATINMAMVMGLVPVVGVPLPLISYGGSAMITSWVAVGLLQSLQRFGTRF